MKGFFTQKETKSISRPDGKVYSCASCGLYKNAKTPKMKPYGNFKKKILNIGEYPFKEDDERGRPWSGKYGQLLKRTYAKFGVDLFEDCLNVNAINCHPQGKPTNYSVDCCKSVLVGNIIAEYQPNLIVLLGPAALYSFMSNHWGKDMNDISKWRGFVIPDKTYKCWVAPVFPVYYIDPDKPEISTIWEQDLQKALVLADKPLPRHKQPKINIIEDLSVLSTIKDGSTIAFDYETTGIKPHDTGHRIVCASVAVTPNLAYSFMMPNTKKEREPLVKLLKNEHIYKMGHNIKFEEAWSVVKLKTPVENWFWDSMLAAHVLDNRPGISGLKFQTYVHFGVVDYSSEVTPYLKSGSKDGNALNKLLEYVETTEGRNKVLEYCGYDSIYGYRLAVQQQELMLYDMLPF